MTQQDSKQGVIKSKVFIRGVMTARTGLHIGGNSVGMAIGGADSVIVRNPVNNRPYVPGSSLRGKMRSLMERVRGEEGHGPEGGFSWNGQESLAGKDPSTLLGKLFGTAAETEGTPTRLIVRDAHLTPESEQELLNAPNADMPMTEVKTEVWIDAAIWSDVARDPGNLVDDRYTHIRGPLGMKPDNARHLPRDFVLWQEEERPRLALNRNDNRALKGLLFHFSRIHYHPDGGLWFLASFADPSAKRSFEAALDWLGDSGIGADRSNGNGFFQASALAKVPVQEAQEGRPAISLSLVNPSEQDRSSAFLEDAAYDLVRRGGWISGSSRRKPALRMFAEGSRFCTPLRGRVIELCRHPRDGRPIWRDGRGLFAAG
ncbi:MAG: type III-A CRISPR-associated RAMP protein Csm3 [Pseudomonadota bacterium]|nr:type III-A CRISPR-associated RAMP protein Csm3 [Pseudomonadota bacterium]